MGEVGLPTFVGLVSFEANIRRFGAFPGFGNNQAGFFQDAADCGAGGSGKIIHQQAVSNRLRACVKAIMCELVAKLDDSFNKVGWGLVFIGVGSSRLGFQPGFSVAFVSGYEFMNPLP